MQISSSTDALVKTPKKSPHTHIKKKKKLTKWYVQAVNELSFVEWYMFKLGSSGKIKSSSLPKTCDKPKNSV